MMKPERISTERTHVDILTTDIKLETASRSCPILYTLHWAPLHYECTDGKTCTLWKDESELPIDIHESYTQGYSPITKGFIDCGRMLLFLPDEVHSLEELEPGTFYLESAE